jgi:RNA polymerase primary sigma factor
MSRTLVKNGAVSNSLQVYLREIKDESLLSGAEECALADAIARGDRDARTRMIQANLRLVVTIAREFIGRGLALDDLIGEGNLGLIRAAAEFQPRFGTRFSTYASYWIKQSIRHALINTTCTIRLPAHMVGLLTKWRRAERALARERGDTPSFEEVVAVLGLSETQKTLLAKARQALRCSPEGNVTLDSGRHAHGQSSDCGDACAASLETADEWNILRLRMRRLEERECTVLKWRHGLDGESPLTLKEVSRRLGITREWARKIELRAVRKLADDAEADWGKGSGGGCAAARAARRPRWPSRGAAGQKRRCALDTVPASP